MSTGGYEFAARVAKAVLLKYENLPKKGKPTQGEWTPLAAVVCKITDGVRTLTCTYTYMHLHMYICWTIRIDHLSSSVRRVPFFFFTRY